MTQLNNVDAAGSLALIEDADITDVAVMGELALGINEEDSERATDVLEQLREISDRAAEFPVDAFFDELSNDLPEAKVSINESKETGKRKPVVPPAVVTEEMSLYEYLEGCTPPLTQKIIDIACAQSKVPYSLWDEAAQEIRLRWVMQKPDVDNYKPGQIASYAHRMATNTALYVRRELGSPVRLPGSAFRKRKDGTTYVTPGVLANALDWDALEGWYNNDDPNNSEPSETGVGNGISVTGGMTTEPFAEDSEEAALKEERLDILQRSRDDLTPRQFNIMLELVDGSNFDEIMKTHDIKRGILMREVAIISSVVDV